MDSLTTAPIADLLTLLFQKAEAADRPLVDAFSREGAGVLEEQMKKVLEDKAKDYQAV